MNDKYIMESLFFYIKQFLEIINETINFEKNFKYLQLLALIKFDTI